MTEKDVCMLRSNRQVVELEKIVENIRVRFMNVTLGSDYTSFFILML